MSYRKVFEDSPDGNCPICGSEAREYRNNSRIELNGWYCSNEDCQYSFDNYAASRPQEKGGCLKWVLIIVVGLFVWGLIVQNCMYK